mmetsp:Transcript_44244/g.139579  ORF Transcript_44244/g.139579 Transcript_44244/m.139579 type:complete len:203 (-) Transcript_44244:218-826(-)
MRRERMEMLAQTHKLLRSLCPCDACWFPSAFPSRWHPRQVARCALGVSRRVLESASSRQVVVEIASSSAAPPAKLLPTTSAQENQEQSRDRRALHLRSCQDGRLLHPHCEVRQRREPAGEGRMRLCRPLPSRCPPALLPLWPQTGVPGDRQRGGYSKVSRDRLGGLQLEYRQAQTVQQHVAHRASNSSSCYECLSSRPLQPR